MWQLEYSNDIYEQTRVVDQRNWAYGMSIFAMRLPPPNIFIGSVLYLRDLGKWTKMTSLVA